MLTRFVWPVEKSIQPKELRSSDWVRNFPLSAARTVVLAGSGISRINLPVVVSQILAELLSRSVVTSFELSGEKNALHTPLSVAIGLPRNVQSFAVCGKERLRLRVQAKIRLPSGEN